MESVTIFLISLHAPTKNVTILFSTRLVKAIIFSHERSCRLFCQTVQNSTRGPKNLIFLKKIEMFWDLPKNFDAILKKV